MDKSLSCHFSLVKDQNWTLSMCGIVFVAMYLMFIGANCIWSFYVDLSTNFSDDSDLISIFDFLKLLFGILLIICVQLLQISLVQKNTSTYYRRALFVLKDYKIKVIVNWPREGSGDLIFINCLKIANKSFQNGIISCIK